MRSTIQMTLAILAGYASTFPLQVTDNVYEWLGRVNPSTRELSWPGTGVSFNFTGSAATINIASVTGTNSVDLSIDGGAPINISDVVGPSITTPAGLAFGKHNVVLRKRSETALGSIFLGALTVQGTPIAQQPPRRKIEVIGDSITVGYGLDGVLPCVNTAALEDNWLTYEAITARALNAQYSVVAWSGKGLVRNYVQATPDTSPTMPELWTRYGANDADDSYPFPSDQMPDAVVINLGTNDFSYAGTYDNGTLYAIRPPINAATFTTAMVNFVRQVERHYPKAHFFLMSSPLLSDSYPTAADAQHTTHANALKAAIAQLGGTTYHFVEWAPQGSAVGCDYHPNAATHAAEATVLTAIIKQALVW